MSGSVDCVLNIFALFSLYRVSRILKKTGIVIVVNLRERHIVELKDLLYESVRYHDVVEIYTGLTLLNRYQMNYSFNIEEEDV